jgi:hypothetical protein
MGSARDSFVVRTSMQKIEENRQSSTHEVHAALTEIGVPETGCTGLQRTRARDTGGLRSVSPFWRLLWPEHGRRVR